MGVIVVIIFLILCIIIGLCFFIYYRKKNTINSIKPKDFTISNYTVWNKKPSDCGIYDIWPPTLQTDVLDNIPQVDASCYFSDQIVAARTVATCEDKQIKGATGYINLCIDDKGNYANVGDTYVYYDNQLCSSLTPCPGSIGILSLPYFKGDSNKAATTCLISDGNTLQYAPCDPQNRQQNFNGGRYSLSFNGYYPDNNGLFYQFNFRPNSKCLDNTLSLSTCPSDPQWLQVPAFSYYYHTPIPPQGSTVPPGPFTGPYIENDPSNPIPPGFTGITINFPTSLVSLSSLDVDELKKETDKDVLLKYIYNNAKVLTFTTPPSLTTYEQALNSPQSIINNTVYIVNTLFVDVNLFNLLQNINS
jgi:hypothetical protein